MQYILVLKLMNLGVPPTVLSLLMTWYSRNTAFVKWGISTSYTIALLAGVRQGGVLSPLLFCVYVDGIIWKLESSKLGCWIGDCYVGCVMYADDLVLISSRICEQQKMIDDDMCGDEVNKINMQLNKTSVLFAGLVCTGVDIPYSKTCTRYDRLSQQQLSFLFTFEPI